MSDSDENYAGVHSKNSSLQFDEEPHNHHDRLHYASVPPTPNGLTSKNPFKRFFAKFSRFLKRHKNDYQEEWLKKNQEIVKKYGGRERLDDDKIAQQRSSQNSLYNLIKHFLPSSNNNNKPPAQKPILQAHIKSRESSEPIKSSQAGNNDGNILDVSSPLVREEWKNDASLVLEGKYELLSATPFTSKYSCTSLIGQGSFGFVLKAQRIRDERPVAVKFILKRLVNKAAWVFNSELGLVPSEVHFLQTLSHPGIVQFLDCFDDGKYIYLVTEIHGTCWNLARNPQLNPRRNPGLKNAPPIGPSKAEEKEESPCDLFECIECHYYLPEETIHYIFVQLYDVVKYLAEQGIVHRDLKDENVVIDADYRIKIIDFGSASFIPKLPTALIVEGSASSTFSNEGWFDKFNGTLAFAPPEVVRGLRYKGTESEAWTLGILLFTMAFRQSPFPDSQSILYGRLDFPFEEDEPGKFF